MYGMTPPPVHATGSLTTAISEAKDYYARDGVVAQLEIEPFGMGDQEPQEGETLLGACRRWLYGMGAKLQQELRDRFKVLEEAVAAATSAQTAACDRLDDHAEELRHMGAVVKDLQAADDQNQLVIIEMTEQFDKFKRDADDGEMGRVVAVAQHAVNHHVNTTEHLLAPYYFI